MPVALRLLPGKGLDHGYSSADFDGWKPPEVKVVTGKQAKYLRRHFPDCFELAVGHLPASLASEPDDDDDDDEPDAPPSVADLSDDERTALLALLQGDKQQLFDAIAQANAAQLAVLFDLESSGQRRDDVGAALLERRSELQRQED